MGQNLLKEDFITRNPECASCCALCHGTAGSPLPPWGLLASGGRAGVGC